MASIEIRKLSHRYGKQDALALDDVSLAWEDGTACALLGPSGCGKSTLLNILSGLLRPTRGDVRFDGRDVTGLSPRERHIAQVFQFPVVYDTMSVRQNLAFPLNNMGIRGRDAARRVDEVAELLELRDELGTPARQLDVARKQVLSLGRGVVREDTAAVLLDEPLTVIDPKAKWRLRRTLREVQRATKLTMIYVTHDQHEALTFADEVTIMKAGRVEQTGTPEALHDEPATPFVGYFIGRPGMNLFPYRLDAGRLLVADCPLPAPGGSIADTGTAGIRPEHVVVSRVATPDGLPATVRGVERAASYRILTLEIEGSTLRARYRSSEPVGPGDTVWLGFPEEHLRYFPCEDAARLGRAV